jgi:hypothetical protein
MVIAKAQKLDSILLSLNGDFADIVTYPPKSYQGIVATIQKSFLNSWPASQLIWSYPRRGSITKGNYS